MAKGRRRFSRILIGCMCAMILSAPASQAFALDKKQIINMKKIGLDDKAIKGAIDSAGDELMLNDKDLAELKKNGVSKGILDHLKKTGHVKTKATANTTKPPAPGTTNPPAPGETGPAPNTGETEEEKQARLKKAADDKAAQEKAIAAEIKRREEAAKRAQQLKSEALRLPGALQAVKDGKNMEAARVCLRYLSFKPDPKSKSWYNAKYCLAKSLYQEGILSGASRPLVEVLLRGSGAENPHFKEGFYMLENLSAKIGYRPPLLAELTKINEAGLNQKFRDDFNYFMGKFFYDYRNMAKAKEHLAKVKKKAPDYPEARYLIGVATLGEVKNEDDLRKLAPASARAFQEAIVASESEKGNEDILQLGYLALARLYYELGFYNVAMFNYGKLPDNSSRNAEAMYEIAWTYFLKNDFKRALGVFQQLNSPYYSKWFYPDIGILEATVYLNLCNFQKSKLVLARLQKRYLDKRPALKKFMGEALKENRGPAWLWKSMVNYYKGGGEKKYGLPRLFADAVMDDLAFYNTYKQIQVLQKERKALKANIGTLGDLGKEVLKRVDEQLRIKINEGGTIVQQRLASLDKELQGIDLQATQISFDIDKEEKDQLQQRLSNKKIKKNADVGTTLFIVADDWHPWPFEGEYWIDEIGNYRSNLRTECVAK